MYLFVSSNFFLYDPAFKPILIGTLYSFATLIISETFSLEPILAGFILILSAPFFITSTANL